MEEKRVINEALEFFLDEERKAAKVCPWYWLAMLIAAALIAANFYFFVKGNEIAEMSLQLTSQADSEGVKALLSLVDGKLELLRSEMRLKSNLMGIMGGGMLGVSIGALVNRRNRVKKYRVVQKLINTIKRDS